MMIGMPRREGTKNFFLASFRLGVHNKTMVTLPRKGINAACHAFPGVAGCKNGIPPCCRSAGGRCKLPTATGGEGRNKKTFTNLKFKN